MTIVLIGVGVILSILGPVTGDHFYTWLGGACFGAMGIVRAVKEHTGEVSGDERNDHCGKG